MIRLKLSNLSCAIALALLALVTPAIAAPTLQPIESPLPSSVPEKSPIQYRFRYINSSDDRIRKATLIDHSASGITKTPASSISAGDTSKGVEIDWSLKDLEPGGHQMEFVVETAAENTRYPLAPDEMYNFSVEQMLVKWGTFAFGVVVGLAFLPFLVYQISRSINQRGDPSRAARGALLIGILMCGALFISLFHGTFGLWGIGIAILGAMAAIVMVLTRR